MEALTGERSDADEFDLIEKLSEISGYDVPAPIGALKGKTPRFTASCHKDEMKHVVLKMLGIGD